MLDKKPQHQTVTLKGAVDGDYLSDATGRTSWGFAGADWSTEAHNYTEYLVTIPPNAAGTMTVTCVPKDDPTKVITVVITVA